MKKAIFGLQSTKDELNLLSAGFSNVLKEWLTAEEMAEVIRRNALPAYAGACASHDFCDANMAMAEAFEKIFGEFDFSSDIHSALFNGAWNIAKANKFYTV